ncbi:hypothetical protein QZH41_010930 [Actinostola sp. cb2023]|nr:hypothetical protein QZH41_010930 [Actinostola sp. cb2023]
MALKILRICCSPASSPRLPDSRWSWLVCLAGSVTWAFSFGITQCYAVLMPVIMDHFKSSREATAWAGSIPTSLAFATIPLCSKVVDRINIRYVGEDEESEEEKVAFCAGLREVFKRPQYVIAIVSLMLQTLTAFVSYVHLISYCQEVGIPPSKASNLFIAIGLSSLCSSLIAGRVVDIHSINPLHISQVGSLSMALSMLLLQLATEYYHFVIYSVFLGFGIGILVTIIVLLMLRTVEPRLRSVSFPFGQMCTSLGNLTGPPLIGKSPVNVNPRPPNPGN